MVELLVKTLAGWLAQFLLPELTLLRQELQGINQTLLMIAGALDYRNAQDYGITIQPTPGVPAVDIAYVNDGYQAEIMDIELRLTGASGAPPTEDEILAEYERRHGPEGGTPA